MATVRFTAEIDADHTIHPPADVRLVPGKAEVVVTQPCDAANEPMGEGDTFPTAVPAIATDLAEFASQHGAVGLPPDLALNHDHYLHGAPKGIDQP
jgi:hypothetical protein